MMFKDIGDLANLLTGVGVIASLLYLASRNTSNADAWDIDSSACNAAPAT